MSLTVASPESGPSVEDGGVNESHVPDSSPKKEESYVPRTIVLAKVKGYPSWPAMILDESYLPDNIVSKKPKSVRVSGKKKSTKVVKILAVRFFSDDTYIWIRSNDLKLLTQDMIDKYFSNERRRKDKLLDTAYKLAKNPPDMELFIRWGSRGEPPVVKPEPEEEEEEPEDLGLGDEDIDVDVGEEGEEDYEEPAPKRLKKNNSSKKPSKAKETKETKAPKKKPAKPAIDPREEGYDSDWGIEEVKSYNFGDGSYIFDNEKDQIKFEKNFPSAAELSEELAEYHRQFDDLDRDISRQLLEDEIDEQEVLANLKELSQLKLPKTVIVKSKLSRTFIIVMRKPEEHFPYPTIKSKIASLLHKWVDLTVPENSLEDMQLPDANDEAQDPTSQTEGNNKAATPSTTIGGSDPNEGDGKSADPATNELNGFHKDSQGPEVGSEAEKVQTSV